jgi:hypothetical protein
MAVSDPNQLCPKWGPLNKYDLLDYIDYYKSSKRRAPRWYHHPNILNLPKNTMEMNLFPIVYSHWIGWKEHLQENGIFHGNIHWYIWPKSDPKIQLVSIDIFNIHGYIDKIWYFHCLVPIDPKKSPDFVLFVLKSPPRSRKRRWRRSRRSTSHGFMWETRCHKELPLGMIHTYSYHIHTHNRYIYIHTNIHTYSISHPLFIQTKVILVMVNGTEFTTLTGWFGCPPWLGNGKAIVGGGTLNESHANDFDGF